MLALLFGRNLGPNLVQGEIFVVYWLAAAVLTLVAVYSPTNSGHLVISQFQQVLHLTERLAGNDLIE
jgi:hypothetical protein